MDDHQDLVVRPIWWQWLIGIAQVLKFAVLILLVLVHAQMFVPHSIQQDADESTLKLVYMFAHDDGCSAVPMVFLGVVSMFTKSVEVLRTVEWIQTSYFVVYIANMIREIIQWGVDDVLSLVLAPVLLVAHVWMLWKAQSCTSLERARVVARTEDTYEPIVP